MRSTSARHAQAFPGSWPGRIVLSFSPGTAGRTRSNRGAAMPGARQ